MLTLRGCAAWFALLLLQGNPLLSLAAVLPLLGYNDSTSLLSFEITQDSKTPDLRAAGVDTKRATFLYGPAVAGGPFYPIGPLALMKKGADLTAVQVDEAPQLTGATTDQMEATLEAADVTMISFFVSELLKLTARSMRVCRHWRTTRSSTTMVAGRQRCLVGQILESWPTTLKTSSSVWRDWPIVHIK